MLEVAGLVADDLGRDTALRHPGPEHRDVGIGPRLLGAGVGEEYHVDRFAAFGELDDHGGGIDAGTPGGDHGRAISHWPRPWGRSPRGRYGRTACESRDTADRAGLGIAEQGRAALRIGDDLEASAVATVAEAHGLVEDDGLPGFGDGLGPLQLASGRGWRGIARAIHAAYSLSVRSARRGSRRGSRFRSGPTFSVMSL